MLVLAGESVLITGGTGTFGNAFARRALALAARKVVVFSRSESKQAAMKEAIPDDRMRFLIGDVRDGVRLMDALRGIDVVIHAAALKRVEVCEADPKEAVATNIHGTENVARACVERGVRKAVFLSTDKAAAPVTLYGMTKAAAERVWVQSNNYSAGTPTRFAATRYGNVVGSTGSVFPTWRMQFETFGHITITDPLMTRFLMSIEQAVDLVLLALREMQGGELYVPKVPSMSVADMAGALYPAAQRRIVGLRPGEKMHELLISADESRHTFDCGAFYQVEPEVRLWGAVDPPKGMRVPDGFYYRSDSNPDRLSAEALRAMVGHGRAA